MPCLNSLCLLPRALILASLDLQRSASTFGDPSEAGQLPPSLERQEFTGSGAGDGEEPEVSRYGSELGNVDSEGALALEGRSDEEETCGATFRSRRLSRK